MITPPPTPEQAEAVVQFTTGDPMKMIAFAGAGKTSTLTLMAKQVPNRRGLMMCFNKSIATEAAQKFPRNITCKTAHSLAYGTIVKRGFDPETKMTKVPRSRNFDVSCVREKIPFHADIFKTIVATTITRFCQSDRADIVERHVPRVPGFSEADQGFVYKWAPLAATKIWQHMIDPGDDMPMGHDGYVKLWALGNPHLFGDFIMVDEAQDLNPVLIGVILRQSAQIIAVGDSHQCQPTGTMVTRVTKQSNATSPAIHEQVPIEQIKKGDLVVSWSIRGSHFFNNGDLVEEIANREYNDTLIIAKTIEHTTRYTPEHRCIAKLSGGFDGKYFVYLMRKGNSFRIGKTVGVSASQGGRFGCSYRIDNEKCDALWILSEHKTDDEAMFAESVLSHHYNIPKMLFTATSRNTKELQKTLDRFWFTIGDLTENAKRILSKYNRDIRYPIWKKGEGRLIARRAAFIHACNLMDGMQLLSCNSHRKWMSAIFTREHYKGTVHSLKIAKHKTYVADGLVTHNSIYEWRGAKDALGILPGLECRLTTSFRFGDVIATAAGRVLAAMGETVPLSGFPMIRDEVIGLRPSAVDAVLCRSNAGVLDQAFGYIDEGRTVATPGGTGEMRALVEDVEALRQHRPARSASLMGFATWQEVEKHAATDEGRSLAVFVNLVNKYGPTTLLRVLNQIIPYEKNRIPPGTVTISTAHKAKGLEWQCVAINEDFYASDEEDAKISTAERRLFYVAITRAQRTLCIDPTVLDAFSRPNTDED